MKTARIIILGSAALAGVGAFFMILGNAKQPAPIRIAIPAPPPPADQVLVANRDIPFGNMVDRGDLRWQPWPPHAAPAAAILETRDPKGADEFNGWLANVHISEGEPIYRSHLVQLGKEGILATLLPSGMRAVAITIDTGGNSTAGNFIQPGDHVDVIHTFRDDDVARAAGGDGMVSETILHNISVLAIGGAIQKPGREPVISGANATLELKPKEVEQIILAQKTGQLSLSLRSMADSNANADRDAPDKDVNLTIVRFGIPVPGR